MMTIPNSDNWSEGNVAYEVRGLVEKCSWNDIYDFAEDIYGELGSSAVRRGGFHPDPKAVKSAQEAFSIPLNEYFRRRGFAWQLVNGEIEVRGGEVFEATISNARALSTSYGYLTVSGEIHEALQASLEGHPPTSRGLLVTRSRRWKPLRVT
jgi:hypothetical protein